MDNRSKFLLLMVIVAVVVTMANSPLVRQSRERQAVEDATAFVLADEVGRGIVEASDASLGRGIASYRVIIPGDLEISLDFRASVSSLTVETATRELAERTAAEVELPMSIDWIGRRGKLTVAEYEYDKFSRTLTRRD